MTGRKNRQSFHTERNRTVDTLPGSYLTQREADFMENRQSQEIPFSVVEEVYDKMFQEISYSETSVDPFFFRRRGGEKQWSHIHY